MFDMIILAWQKEKQNPPKKLQFARVPKMEESRIAEIFDDAIRNTCSTVQFGSWNM